MVRIIRFQCLNEALAATVILGHTLKRFKIAAIPSNAARSIIDFKIMPLHRKSQSQVPHLWYTIPRKRYMTDPTAHGIPTPKAILSFESKVLLEPDPVFVGVGLLFTGLRPGAGEAVVEEPDKVFVEDAVSGMVVEEDEGFVVVVVGKDEGVVVVIGAVVGEDEGVAVDEDDDEGIVVDEDEGVVVEEDEGIVVDEDEGVVVKEDDVVVVVVGLSIREDEGIVVVIDVVLNGSLVVAETRKFTVEQSYKTVAPSSKTYSPQYG